MKIRQTNESRWEAYLPEDDSLWARGAETPREALANGADELHRKAVDTRARFMAVKCLLDDVLLDGDVSHISPDLYDACDGVRRFLHDLDNEMWDIVKATENLGATVLDTFPEPELTPRERRERLREAAQREIDAGEQLAAFMREDAERRLARLAEADAAEHEQSGGNGVQS